MDNIIKEDLEAAIQEVIDVGLSDVALSREEVMALMLNFYGAVTLASYHAVITPEEAYYLHIWLANNLGL